MSNNEEVIEEIHSNGNGSVDSFQRVKQRFKDRTVVRINSFGILIVIFVDSNGFVIDCSVICLCLVFGRKLSKRRRFYMRNFLIRSAFMHYC